jgi:hypothetical protein
MSPRLKNYFVVRNMVQYGPVRSDQATMRAKTHSKHLCPSKDRIPFNDLHLISNCKSAPDSRVVSLQQGSGSIGLEAHGYS